MSSDQIGREQILLKEIQSLKDVIKYKESESGILQRELREVKNSSQKEVESLQKRLEFLESKLFSSETLCDYYKTENIKLTNRITELNKLLQEERVKSKQMQKTQLGRTEIEVYGSDSIIKDIKEADSERRIKLYADKIAKRDKRIIVVGFRGIQTKLRGLKIDNLMVCGEADIIHRLNKIKRAHIVVLDTNISGKSKGNVALTIDESLNTKLIQHGNKDIEQILKKICDAL